MHSNRRRNMVRKALVKVFPFLVFFCVVALTVSLLVHLSVLFDIDLGIGKQVFILHAVVLILGMLAAFVGYQTVKLHGEGVALRKILQGCPKLLLVMTIAFWVYSFFNFSLCAEGTERFVAPDQANLLEIRKFSGVWMFFFGAYLAFFVSMKNVWQREE